MVSKNGQTATAVMEPDQQAATEVSEDVELWDSQRYSGVTFNKPTEAAMLTEAGVITITGSGKRVLYNRDYVIQKIANALFNDKGMIGNFSEMRALCEEAVEYCEAKVEEEKQGHLREAAEKLSMVNANGKSWTAEQWLKELSK